MSRVNKRFRPTGMGRSGAKRSVKPRTALVLEKDVHRLVKAFIQLAYAEHLMLLCWPKDLDRSEIAALYHAVEQSTHWPLTQGQVNELELKALADSIFSNIRAKVSTFQPGARHPIGKRWVSDIRRNFIKLLFTGGYGLDEEVVRLFAKRQYQHFSQAARSSFTVTVDFFSALGEKQKLFFALLAGYNGSEFFDPEFGSMDGFNTQKLTCFYLALFEKLASMSSIAALFDTDEGRVDLKACYRNVLYSLLIDSYRVSDDAQRQRTREAVAAMSPVGSPVSLFFDGGSTAPLEVREAEAKDDSRLASRK